MMNQITGDVVRKIFAVQLSSQQESISHEEMEEEIEEEMSHDFQPQTMQYNLASDGSLIPQESPAPLPQVQEEKPKAQALDYTQNMRAPRQMSLSRGPMPAGPVGALTPQPVGGGSPDVAKAGRNDPCPCGSGKKYKKCHGA
jgi:uncharacterized protein YecA (UPF0149 family)